MTHTEGAVADYNSGNGSPTLTDFFILKENSAAPPRGRNRCIRDIIIYGDDDFNDSTNELRDKMIEVFGVVGDDLIQALIELKINAQEHGFNYDHKKKIRVRIWKDDVNGYLAMDASGAPFDPRTLKIETQRVKDGRLIRRHGGLAIVRGMVDYAHIDPTGEGAAMIKTLYN